jgi:hypothetical protein
MKELSEPAMRMMLKIKDDEKKRLLTPDFCILSLMHPSIHIDDDNGGDNDNDDKNTEKKPL